MPLRGLLIIEPSHGDKIKKTLKKIIPIPLVQNIPKNYSSGARVKPKVFCVTNGKRP